MRVRLQGLISTTAHLRSELDKSKTLLTANTLLAIKAENIYGNTTRMDKTIETQSSAIKKLFKSMFLVMKTSLASP